jgi:hypothetical protein
MTAVSDAVLAAWQGALAAEHRAVFGYALLGPHLRGAPRLSLAIGCSNAHEALRDATAAAIAAAGATPVAPAADYPQLYPVDSATQAGALALRLEEGCAAAWRYLYAVAAQTAAATPVRRGAQDALTASAVRATRWRGSGAPPAFPGL